MPTLAPAFRNLVRILNWSFWLASIALWLKIVSRSEFFSADLMSKMFWINGLLFLAAGIGVAATTSFVASALPLLLAVLTITATDVKAGWFWLNLYIVTAIAIGCIALMVNLNRFLDRKA